MTGFDHHAELESYNESMRERDETCEFCGSKDPAESAVHCLRCAHVILEIETRPAQSEEGKNMLKRNSVLNFEEGLLTVKISGHGAADGWATLSFREDQFELDADGHQVVEIAPHELRELRDFLNRVMPIQSRRSTTSEHPISQGMLRTQEIMCAAQQLAEVYRALGLNGSALTENVLIHGLTIEQVCVARGSNTEIERKYLGKRFRECLDCMAKIYGYAMVSHVRQDEG